MSAGTSSLSNVAHIEPSLALTRLERALRQVMEYCYAEKHGAEWLLRVTKDGKPQKWADLAEYETAKRAKRGVVIAATGGLSYAQLYELREVLEKHWEPVAPALGERKEVTVMLKRFDDLRNSVAHSRELLPFEQDLLAGIAGDIENRVTIYMSSQDPSGDYYPRITTVLDSLGNEPDLGQTRTTYSVDTGMNLRPGDVVTFTCRGVDPQGRELEWSLQTGRTGMAWKEQFYADHAVGDDVTMTWEVGREDVRDSSTLYVVMRATNAEFHRQGENDQVAIFFYRVLPPLEG